jgi:Na+/melibiose symporter-like transporter
MVSRANRYAIVYSIVALMLSVFIIVALMKITADPSIEHVYSILQVITGVIGAIAIAFYIRDRYENRQAVKKEKEEVELLEVKVESNVGHTNFSNL